MQRSEEKVEVRIKWWELEKGCPKNERRGKLSRKSQVFNVYPPNCSLP